MYVLIVALEYGVSRLLHQRSTASNDNMSAKAGNAYVYAWKYDSIKIPTAIC